MRHWAVLWKKMPLFLCCRHSILFHKMRLPVSLSTKHPLLCNRKRSHRFPISSLTDFFVWPAVDFKLCDWIRMFGVTLEKHFREKGTEQQRTEIYKCSCVALWERSDGVHGINSNSLLFYFPPLVSPFNSLSETNSVNTSKSRFLHNIQILRR